MDFSALNLVAMEVWKPGGETVEMGNGQRQHRINCTGVHLIDS